MARKPDSHASAAATATAQPLPGRRGSRLKAIGLMCLAVSLFGCLDTTAKYLGTLAGIPVAQVVWMRFLAQMLLFMAAVGPMTLPRLARSNRLCLQFVRSSLLLGATVFNFLALQHLRLDQTTTMFFLTPLTVALLAGPLLGEWVGWRRYLAILVGFMGILVAIRPGIANVHPAFLLSLGAMLSYAGFSLITRHLAPLDHPQVTFFYSMLVGIVLVAPFALTNWVWPQRWQIWALLPLLGVFGGIGHYLFILSNRLAPASVVSPFVYAGLVSNTTLGYLVFGDLPDRWTMLGAGIVVGSGLYLIGRERRPGAGGPA